MAGEVGAKGHGGRVGGEGGESGNGGSGRLQQAYSLRLKLERSEGSSRVKDGDRW